MSDHFEVLIVGGGTGGISVAARLANSENPPTMAIIEPSKTHYYQPLWTLVGAGVFDVKETARPTVDYIPPGVTWIQEYAQSFDAPKNTVTTTEGGSFTYDYLVVAAGIQLNWEGVDGLKESIGKGGVCSNYSETTVESTWAAIQAFRGGNALFTFPNTPIKCPGAPQKIMYLAEETFRHNGVRQKSKVIYSAPGAAMFGIPKYKRALHKVVAKRGIDTLFRSNLIALRPDTKEAVFECLDGGPDTVIKYEMIHVTPPQGPPSFLKSDLTNAGGWVEVDQYTTQHVRFPNVFALGDCTSMPASKTGAAIRKQAPVLVSNLLAVRDGRAPTDRYDGYASCPLVTSRSSAILAEFTYGGVVAESFPFDQAKERYSMYALKAYGLPQLYWHGMLRGNM